MMSGRLCRSFYRMSAPAGLSIKYAAAIEIPVDSYTSSCQLRTSQVVALTEGQSRRKSTSCEVSEALKLPSGQRDYFRLLGVKEETFDIDQQQIEKNYKKLQTVFHPDKYANASQEEKAFSEEASSLVNAAYSALKAPLDRATYMLGRRGIGTDEEREGINDSAFLMDIMEAREAVEDTDDPEALHILKSENVSKQSTVIQGISKAFFKGDLTAANEGKIHLRYVMRILEAIEQKL